MRNSSRGRQSTCDAVTVCSQIKCLSAFAGEKISPTTCDASQVLPRKKKSAEQAFMRVRGDFVTASQVKYPPIEDYEDQNSRKRWASFTRRETDKPA